MLERRGKQGPLRIVGLDPDDGKTTDLGEVHAGAVDHAAVAVGRDGRLVLAVTSAEKTTLRHIALVRGRPVTVDRYETDGRLLGEVVEDGTGVHFTVLRGDAPEARTVPLSDFTSKESPTGT